VRLLSRREREREREKERRERERERERESAAADSKEMTALKWDGEREDDYGAPSWQTQPDTFWRNGANVIQVRFVCIK
jgi:hypothetical protein